MTERDEWVFRVLGVHVAAPQQGVSGSDQPELSHDDVVSQLRERTKEMLIEAKLLGDPQALSAIAKLAAQAQAAIQGGDLVAAELAVDAVEQAVADAKRQKNRSEASQVKGRVSYTKAQLDWRKARTAAFASMNTLVGRITSDSRLDDEPDREQLLAIVQGFPDLLPSFDEALEEQLDAIDRLSDPEQRKPLIAEAKSTLSDYRSVLSDEALHKLQALSDDEFGGIDVLHTLETALTQIEHLLAA